MRSLADWRVAQRIQAQRDRDQEVAKKAADSKAICKSIAGQCPKIRVGERWKDLWLFPGIVEVTGWKSLEEDGLPWPMVSVRLIPDQLVLGEKDLRQALSESRTGEVGLPAFLFARRVKGSKGLAWAPEERSKKTRKPRTVYLDREKK